MSEQHTKEPWKVSGTEHIVAGGNYVVALDCKPEDARRIVACVNACAGLSTQCLEETGGGVEHYIAVIKQRDDLLAALEGARESLDAIRLAVEPYDDIKPRDWKSDRANLRDAHTSAKETIEAVDTAIASVKANT